MKKLLKVGAWAIGGLVGLIAVAAGAVFVSSNGKFNQTYAVTVKPVRIPTDATAVARGQHIAQTRGCMDCHGRDLGGAKVIEDGAMGKLHGANLTRGAGSRIATWKDEDWVRAIRHGVGPDARGLFLMPSQEYSHLSDEDLGALIAFLKTVPPVNRDRVAIELGPVTRVLLTVGKMKLAAEEIDHANLRPASVAPGVTVEYGRYVAAGCTGCHGANFSGGKIDIGPPDWPQAANLTPHADGRMAKWTEEDFVRTIRTAKRPDGTEVHPVMPRAFGQMDDTELKALYAFFKTLPAAQKGTR
ncbi:MAG: cytochrome c [Verrucomicrobia bacterium]|nr:cytochrome c [Verrucomicrobiota bacterium]